MEQVSTRTPVNHGCRPARRDCLEVFARASLPDSSFSGRPLPHDIPGRFFLGSGTKAGRGSVRSQGSRSSPLTVHAPYCAM